VLLGACLAVSGCGSADGSATAGPAHVAPVTTLVLRGDDNNDSINATSVPHCSTPLTVKGHASTDQVDLVSCYVQALVRRDLSGLADVARISAGDEIRFTAAKDLRYAHDAAVGTPTATFDPNLVDDADATVYLRFATGRHETLSMDIQNPTSTHSWRLNLGIIKNTSLPQIAAVPIVPPRPQASGARR